MAAAESRGELIAWVNELLNLNYTKIEQLGTGAAYVQIMDTIFHDLPMGRVKFATKHEYEYLGNYKILQGCFTSHKIDKAVPTDRLMKCKMQDNLEFLQWIRKFWNSNYNGEPYDPVARRGASNEPPASANRSATTSARRPVGNGANRSMSGRDGHLSAVANRSIRGPSPDHTIILNLQKELQEERNTVLALEKERDFYFAKLRDVEVLVQQELEASPESAEMPLVKEIQHVLYSTEDGFEAPPEEHGHGHGTVDEYPDETF
ncbi:microtubule-associated protein RP/EB family member 1 [Mortierella sp. GBAus27b]|nr:hypothetical protein BGX31_000136 [Mortierella sp. GBA43]KAI8355742.1 microtubule-associated protein RP/EB family member 1 [Mortierella sp. GBAus27b]